jgi:flagellar basal-body rod protein FlgB
VGPIYLFDVASRQAQWLSLRQATIAQNIANVNTPGYQTRDVEPFAETLDKTGLAMATTQPAHMEIQTGSVRTAEARPSQGWGVTQSGNSVSLEQELMKAGEVNRDYSLNTSIVKAFHRMWMAGVKS